MSFEWQGAGPPPYLSLPARFYATTGICVQKDGRNESEDLTLAARNALLNMIDHLQDTYGYSDKQAYHLCSVAGNLKSQPSGGPAKCASFRHSAAGYLRLLEPRLIVLPPGYVIVISSKNKP